ncbi:hypothetical protein [Actinacidiphila oryziradicis]|uniref:hypothetical protein n=1 Tax=Actinacidiphila oryziradicis TaxID=2571141 RepID=UPI0023EF85DD|nr:hypothetical protein [Actinacidiphila oryziradicis]MCW2869699.1 hypothetical protein [Actinacidiphila oryziradicis]
MTHTAGTSPAFANPGWTEVSLPEDPDFLPALHEDSVVGAPATARVNRASLVS